MCWHPFLSDTQWHSHFDEINQQQEVRLRPTASSLPTNCKQHSQEEDQEVLTVGDE